MKRYPLPGVDGMMPPASSWRSRRRDWHPTLPVRMRPSCRRTIRLQLRRLQGPMEPVWTAQDASGGLWREAADPAGRVLAALTVLPGPPGSARADFPCPRSSTGIGRSSGSPPDRGAARRRAPDRHVADPNGCVLYVPHTACRPSYPGRQSTGWCLSSLGSPPRRTGRGGGAFRPGRLRAAWTHGRRMTYADLSPASPATSRASA